MRVKAPRVFLAINPKTGRVRRYKPTGAGALSNARVEVTSEADCSDPKQLGAVAAQGILEKLRINGTV